MSHENTAGPPVASCSAEELQIIAGLCMRKIGSLRRAMWVAAPPSRGSRPPGLCSSTVNNVDRYETTGGGVQWIQIPRVRTGSSLGDQHPGGDEDDQRRGMMGWCHGQGDSQPAESRLANSPMDCQQRLVSMTCMTLTKRVSEVRDQNSSHSCARQSINQSHHGMMPRAQGGVLLVAGQRQAMAMQGTPEAGRKGRSLSKGAALRACGTRD